MADTPAPKSKPISVDTSKLDPEYMTDPNGNTYVNSYYGLTTINGKKVAATTDADGNLLRAAQINSEKNPQYYTQYDSQLNPIGTSQYLDMSKSMGFGNALKTIAPLFLGAAFPGLGTAIGEGLGLTGSAASAAGGAALGAGKAALTGGNPLTGALTGGLGGLGGVEIGDTGATVGNVMTAANVLKAADKGDFMSALSGVSNLTGGSDLKIGDFTVGELLKDAKLAQSVLGKNPSALNTLANFANTKQNDVVDTLKNAGLAQTDANPTTPAAPTAAPTTPMPAAQQPTGVDPMALLQSQMAGNNNGAQIKSDYSLFGKDYFDSNKASAPSTQKDNAPSSDALLAALGAGSNDEQGFSGGGDVHALLQLLRS
jgi:hypothetical protein